MVTVRCRSRRQAVFLNFSLSRGRRSCFLDRPPRVDQELVDIPGDEPGAHDSQRTGPPRSPAQPVRGEHGRSGGPCGRDDRTLEDGEGVTGVVAIEHEDGRGTRKTSLDVAGETGDPLQPGHVEAVSQVGRKRDDPAIGLVGEPQEVAIGIDGPSVGVREIGRPHDLDAFLPIGADDVGDGLAIDDRELERHASSYSSLVTQLASNTVSRYAVPRSAHRNSTVGRLDPVIFSL